MNYKSWWCGDVCINGNCPIANAEELTDRSIPVPKNCKECYERTDDCKDCYHYCDGLCTVTKTRVDYTK